MQTYVEREIEIATQKILGGDPVARTSGLATIKRFQPVSGADRLVWRYRKENESLIRERIRSAYRDLTGKDVERRLVELSD